MNCVIGGNGLVSGLFGSYKSIETVADSVIAVATEAFERLYLTFGEMLKSCETLEALNWV